jgi:hypothetical protein
MARHNQGGNRGRARGGEFGPAATERWNDMRAFVPKWHDLAGGMRGTGAAGEGSLELTKTTQELTIGQANNGAAVLVLFTVSLRSILIAFV